MTGQTKLTVIDGETLMDMRLLPTRFCVDTLLPQGLSILGGAPKIGKSWLVLDLCIRVAKGEPVWNLPTSKGTTLYTYAVCRDIRSAFHIDVVRLSCDVRDL